MLGNRGPLELALPRLVGMDRGDIDPKVFEHTRVVDPVIVQNIRSYLRDGKYDSKAVFKHVMRFWKVIRAYQSKREGWTNAKAQLVLAKLKGAFGPAVGPGGVLQLLQ